MITLDMARTKRLFILCPNHYDDEGYMLALLVGVIIRVFIEISFKDAGFFGLTIRMI